MLCISSTLVRAEKIESFDETVNELKNSLKDPAPQKSFVPSQIHAGAAFVASYIQVGSPVTQTSSGFLKGYALHLGMDLNPHWVLEGAFRSFATEALKSNQSIGATEFEAQIIYLNEYARDLLLRFGGGASSRNLKITDAKFGRDTVETTPTFVASFGVEKILNPRFRIGPELAFRTPFTSQSSERGALDASLRLNMVF